MWARWISQCETHPSHIDPDVTLTHPYGIYSERPVSVSDDLTMSRRAPKQNKSSVEAQWAFLFRIAGHLSRRELGSQLWEPGREIRSWRVPWREETPNTPFPAQNKNKLLYEVDHWYQLVGLWYSVLSPNWCKNNYLTWQFYYNCQQFPRKKQFNIKWYKRVRGSHDMELRQFHQ